MLVSLDHPLGNCALARCCTQIAPTECGGGLHTGFTLFISKVSLPMTTFKRDFNFKGLWIETRWPARASGNYNRGPLGDGFILPAAH